MTLSVKTRLGFFAALYLLQGAALAYVVNFQKPYLAAHGVPKTTLGWFSALLLVPFLGKVGLGALSDRAGARKAFMLGALIVFAGCYMTLARLHPGTQFTAFATTTWVGSLALALFDTCADGWAIDVTARGEEGAIQGAMVAGKSLGLIFGALLFGYLARGGYAPVFNVLAFLALLGLGAVAAMPYRPRARPTERAPRRPRFAAPGTAWFALYGVVYSTASFGADGLMTLHLMETRLAPSDVIGWYGVARGLGALLGALGYVRLTRRLGHGRVRLIALGVLGLGCLTPLAALNVGVAGLLWGFCWGLQETAFVTLAMRLAEGRWAATVFAALMIFSNVGTSLGEALAAPLVTHLGYGGVFLACAALAWAAAAPLVRSRANALR